MPPTTLDLVSLLATSTTFDDGPMREVEGVLAESALTGVLANPTSDPARVTALFDNPRRAARRPVGEVAAALKGHALDGATLRALAQADERVGTALAMVRFQDVGGGLLADLWSRSPAVADYIAFRPQRFALATRADIADLFVRASSNGRARLLLGLPRAVATPLADLAWSLSVTPGLCPVDPEAYPEMAAGRAARVVAAVVLARWPGWAERVVNSGAATPPWLYAVCDSDYVADPERGHRLVAMLGQDWLRANEIPRLSDRDAVHDSIDEMLSLIIRNPLTDPGVRAAAEGLHHLHSRPAVEAINPAEMRDSLDPAFTYLTEPIAGTWWRVRPVALARAGRDTAIRRRVRSELEGALRSSGWDEGERTFASLMDDDADDEGDLARQIRLLGGAGTWPTRMSPELAALPLGGVLGHCTSDDGDSLEGVRLCTGVATEVAKALGADPDAYRRLLALAGTWRLSLGELLSTIRTLRGDS